MHKMGLYGMALGFLLIGSQSIWAQPDNGEVYTSLLGPFLTDSLTGIKEIKGERIEGYFPDIQIDSMGRIRVRISETQITYQKLEEKQIERKVAIPLSIQDTVLRSRQLVYQDTLSLRRFKQIYKSSPMQLRGDSPKAGAVWIRPIAIIGGTLGAILGLFLIRSS